MRPTRWPKTSHPLICWLILVVATPVTNGLGAELPGTEHPRTGTETSSNTSLPPEQQSTEQQVDRLVEMLASGKFKTREAASEELYQLGATAIPSMRRHREGLTDAEQIDRLERIVAKLTDHAFENQIENFLQGKPTDLNGWPEFEEIFGDTPQVREMFVDLFREHPYAVKALGGTKREVLEAITKVNSRLRQLGIGISKTPRRIDLLALLLPPTISDVETDAQYDIGIYSLLNLHPANEMRGDPAFGEPFTKVVVKWMEKSHLSIRDRVLRIALDWKLDIARDLAIKTLSQNPDPQLLSRAIQALASRGTLADTALLAKYLNDPTVVVRNHYIGSTESNVQIRDVAAAAIAHLHSVPVTDVGFIKPASHDILGIIIEDLVVHVEDPSDRLPALQREDDSGDDNNEPGEELEIEMSAEEKEAWEDIKKQLEEHGMEAGPRELKQFQLYQLQRRAEAKARETIRRNVLKLMRGGEPEASDLEPVGDGNLKRSAG